MRKLVEADTMLSSPTGQHCWIQQAQCPMYCLLLTLQTKGFCINVFSVLGDCCISTNKGSSNDANIDRILWIHFDAHGSSGCYCALLQILLQLTNVWPTIRISSGSLLVHQIHLSPCTASGETLDSPFPIERSSTKSADCSASQTSYT